MSKPPMKPEPPQIIRMREDQTVAVKPPPPIIEKPIEPALTINYEPLNANNQNYLIRFTRRLKEIMLDAQKRRACGRIFIAAGITDGTINRKASVHGEWEEAIDR